MQQKRLKLPLDFKSQLHRNGQSLSETLLKDDICEEESQIECSLPFYMDHIFGTCFTFSQEKSDNLDDSKPSKKTLVGPDHFDDDDLMQDEKIKSVVNSTGCTSSIASGMQSNTQQESMKTSHSAQLPDMSAGNCDVITIKQAVSESCEAPSSKRRRTDVGDTLPYRQPPGCVLLRNCLETDMTVNIFALVLQVNSPMNVTCKRGAVAGQTVLMASILLADPTKAYFKLSLWREAAEWAERVTVGDIVYLRHIRLKLWSNEVVGTTVKCSSILNLHQPNKKLPQKVQESVPNFCVSSLVDWGRKTFAYLFSSPLEPKSQRDVKFHSTQEFIGNSVIHLRAKLLCIVSSRVVLMADGPDANIHIHLIHPPALQWHSELSSGIDEVWECTYMAVVQEEPGTQNCGSYTLQTTYRTTMRRLCSTCPLALDIIKKFPSGEVRGNWVTPCHSLAHMIQFKQSGIYEVNAKASMLEFILPEGKQLHLCPAPNNVLLSQAVYVGCEICSSPLSQDENGIYCQCMPCIVKAPGRGYPSSAYFFRPLLMTLQDSGSNLTVSVLASHVLIPKVLGCNARDIVQASLLESNLEINMRHVITTWVVRCNVCKDENSFIEEFSCTLLDILK